MVLSRVYNYIISFVFGKDWDSRKRYRLKGFGSDLRKN